MGIIKTKVYKFEELNDKAKEKAREWYKDGSEYPWYEESKESIKAFCDEFGVTVKDYSYGPWSYGYIKTDAENANFRGFKLKSFDREKMPTGYGLDSTLRYTFADNFRELGALKAFERALDAAVRDITEDAEFYYSNEVVDEMIIANEYEFTEDGRRI